MRPLEIAFVVIALASLVCVVVPFRGWLAPRVPPLAVFVAMMQASLEGVRWQLAPFELLAALCILFWLHTMRHGLTQPTLFITRDADTMRKEGWAEADIAQTLGTLRATFDRLPVGYFLSIPGMFHPDFSDAPLLSPLARPLGLTGSVPTERAHAIVGGYALAFFDRHVRGEVAPLLDAAPAPDVRFEVRRPPAPRRDGGM